MLQALLEDELPASGDGRQDPWLGFALAVCALSEVDLLREWVCEVFGREGEDGIRRDIGCCGEARSWGCRTHDGCSTVDGGRTETACSIHIRGTPHRYT